SVHYHSECISLPVRATKSVSGNSDMLPPIIKSMLKLAMTRNPTPPVLAAALASLFLLVGGQRCHAQGNGPATSVQLTSGPTNPAPNTNTGAQSSITFADALQRARANDPRFRAAFTAAGL